MSLGKEKPSPVAITISFLIYLFLTNMKLNQSFFLSLIDLIFIEYQTMVVDAEGELIRTKKCMPCPHGTNLWRGQEK